MSEKLMTVRELSEYLGISERAIFKLVEKRVLVAYKIGGELLRFRKEQIDAIRPEIESRVTEEDRTAGKPDRKEQSSRKSVSRSLPAEEEDARSRFSDFLYFNDFYIVSAALAVILLLVIFLG